MALNAHATFDIATRLREPGGAPLGDVFSFMSGLYFRGKIEYARAFTPAEHQRERIKVITSNRGLLSASDRVTRDDLTAFSAVDIADGDPAYLIPLKRDVTRLLRMLPEPGCVVLLGSIATSKYVDVLLSAFGHRLLFPVDFVGRGDMSRGGLLLRHARSGEPLSYVPVAGAARRGKRPPRLPRISR